MRKLAWTMLVTLLLSVAAAAQSDNALQNAFLGREVELKIDMPGTQQGVDLNFSSSQPLNWREYSQRVKSFGIALRKGDTPTVTSIVVKKDRIEFQLDGGGYGTFWDDTSRVLPQMIGKSSYEKQLERDLQNETDPRKRDRIRTELDRERGRREREQWAANSRAQIADQIKQSEIASKRVQGGSRFNLRWTNRIPETDLTPEALMERLSPWVDFRQTKDSRNVLAQDAPAPSALPSTSPVQLQRGMKQSAVEHMLGDGEMLTENKSGDGLRSSEWRYVTPDNYFDVTYVEGVLVRYSIMSR